MLLRDGITLSKKHQKSFQVFPYFFRHALNYFYFLTDECGFLEPKLDIWKNEGMVEFISKDIRILVQYESPAGLMFASRKSAFLDESMNAGFSEGWIFLMMKVY